jgi:hypothetical protein
VSRLFFALLTVRHTSSHSATATTVPLLLAILLTSFATQQSVSKTWTALISKLSQNVCFLSSNTLLVPPGYIKSCIAGNVRYIWTSGRKCNFNGCNRPDLQPPNVNGWFWSGSGAKIGPTTQRTSGDWSHTGGFGQPQPDNREAPQVKNNSNSNFFL